MKKHYTAVIVLFALIILSSLTSLDSFRTTRHIVNEDMNRALTITMQEQKSELISQATIRILNNHLQIAALRGKATLAVDAHSKQFKAYAHCSEATIFSLSDQRPAALLWMFTLLWALFTWHRYKTLPQSPLAIVGNNYGGLIYSELDNRFYTAKGEPVQLTPMQHQLMTMFFQSPAHSLSKGEICATLWPKKPDASETLYTLIKRLKPVVEQHSSLKIESDRSKSYYLTIRQLEN